MRRALIGLGLSACVLDFGRLSGGAPGDAGPDVAPPVDAGEAGDAEKSCPGSAGPPGVRVDAGFCVDKTEVTVDQYAQFLDAGANVTPGPGCGAAAPPNCAQGGGDLPVSCVTWCDAYAFCAWAGKRLCGKIGGGANAVGDENDPSKSEWFYACSSGGANKYPYGNNYTPGTCAAERSSLVPAGNLPGCQAAGIFDMSGNVEEWVNACSDPTDCLARGGNYSSGAADVACNTTSDKLEPKTAGEDGRGFRCCSSP